MKKLCWNVFYNNPNEGIETWNIFRHYSFNNEVETILKEETNKEEFEKRLHKSLMYYFWAKCEYEIIIASWPCYIDHAESQKIKENELPRYRQTVNVEGSNKFSIYDQVELNWNIFVDYCWGFKNEEN